MKLTVHVAILLPYEPSGYPHCGSTVYETNREHDRPNFAGDTGGSQNPGGKLKQSPHEIEPGHQNRGIGSREGAGSKKGNDGTYGCGIRKDCGSQHDSGLSGKGPHVHKGSKDVADKAHGSTGF